ncbi:hypothetical protein ACFWY5_13860 [Nonomuraea sp. NPDC059007]|uniref:hypothetical protein n=1 Tax=Nonomuraea sp. NPDC059007 TaxID=3346692 RepID=UPI0036ACBCDE
MRRSARRILRDVRERRNLDAYVVAVVAIVFAVLTLVGEAVAEQYRWAAILAGMGVLLHRITVPDRSRPPLGDRADFETHPLRDRLTDAKEVWLFAPSGINLLSEANCEIIRRTVLSRSDGVFRVVLLDPEELHAVDLATRQLDAGLEFPLQNLPASIATALDRLAAMTDWHVAGGVEYATFSYNPGFSILAVNPAGGDGTVIVELHGVGNRATDNRMHLELTRRAHGYWYHYWIEQFERIWDSSRVLSRQHGE